METKKQKNLEIMRQEFRIYVNFLDDPYIFVRPAQHHLIMFWRYGALCYA